MVTANTALVSPGQKKNPEFSFWIEEHCAKPMIFNGFKCQKMASVWPEVTAAFVGTRWGP